MRNFKKLLMLLVFVMLAVAMTGCSSMNKITRYFEDAGYVRYEYNFTGGSNLFRIADLLASEEKASDDLTSVTVTTTSQTTTTTITMTTTTSGDETTTTTVPVYDYSFVAYAFSNGDNVVIVLEFDSADYMQTVLDTSASLQAQLQGLDPADYINGNCILIADSSIYDQAVEIFQGLYEAPATTIALE